jgi:hypothetical protein
MRRRYRSAVERRKCPSALLWTDQCPPIAALPLDSPWWQRSVYLGPLVPPVARHLRAPIAQQAERLHGKEKVCGSIPHGGSDSVSGATAHRRNRRPIRAVARLGNW